MTFKNFHNFRQLLRKELSILILMSLGINLLNLTLPLYMLQIYDRIFRTENINSLVLITVVALLALFFMGILQSARGKLIEGLNSQNELENRPIPVSHQTLTPLLDLMWSPLFIIMAFLLSLELGLYMMFAFAVQLACGMLMKFYKKPREQDLSSARRQLSILRQAARHNQNFHQTKTRLGRKITGLKDKLSFAHNGFSALNVKQTTFSQICRLMLQIGVLCLGAFLVIHQNLSPGAVIAVSILLNLVLSPLERFKATADKLKNLMDDPEKPPEICEQAYDKKLENIRLLNITHIFPGMTRPLLHDINMDFTNGQLVGITGPSGVGKTTLAKLLCGMAVPSRGNVLFDFDDGKSIDSNTLAYPLGYMPEKNCLIDGSIGDNIGLYGTYNLGDIRKAARLAGIDEQIMTLPDQYDTRKTPLPAGMKQMLYFARTIYMNAPVLILDHPETALDSQLKSQLHQTLLILKDLNKTIILFSQSKSLLNIADQCFVLKNATLQPFKIIPPALTTIPNTRYRYQQS